MKYQLSAFYLLLPVLFSPNTWACSCAEPSSNPFAEATHIYIGILEHAAVRAYEHKDSPYQAKLVVQQVIKGQQLPGLNLTTPANSSYCGVSLHTEQAYIVFVNADQNPQELIDISACDPSGPLTEKHKQYIKTLQTTPWQ
ncbi:hypothetical protein [Simiduia agarivorans]|uniref:Lipoprotein n=1 Tax=Simiduia agarivorans (strain DSM 21679 / JCM 13881 / BCRC 17597 / SA1) TaxID=1117647 RepID=K4KHH9_SIMAS|nr:hypothetical protein [Simiduia agarivorans]AFU97413.1 hypothetical protein M5M_00900 [Simiduia agarivorans SA1 = DSM 21679]